MDTLDYAALPEDLEELESIRAYDEAKSSEDEVIPFDQAVREIYQVLIDSDNGLGSPKGDVDDAFAVAALLRSGLPVAALTSVGGNTSRELAERNNRVLGELCGYRGPWSLLGITGPVRFLALGPLTNLAAGLGRMEITEAVIVGGNLTSRGRFPPWWPHEFNLTQDREATRKVFDSDLPLTVVPLDVARKLRIAPGQIQGEGPLIDLLRRGSVRWARRSLLLRGSWRFPVFDLAAAAYAIDPSLVTLEETRARLRPNLYIEAGKGDRPLRVVRDLDPERIWRRFFDLVSGSPAAAAAPAPPRPPR